MRRVSSAALLLVSALLAVGATDLPERVFPADSELIYNYLGHVSAGTAQPQEYLSHFSIQGKLRVQTVGEKAKFRLEDVLLSSYNGKGNRHKLPEGEFVSIPAPQDAKAINKPFVAVFSSGKVVSFEYESSDTLWSRNLKRSIVAQFQVDLKEFSFELPRVFTADEMGISGECKTENVIVYGGKPDSFVLRKSQDASRCKGPKYWFDNLSLTSCSTTEPKSPISTSTERNYELQLEKSSVIIKKIKSRSVTSFQPLWVKGELQYIFINQTFTKESRDSISVPLVVSETTPSTLTYEFQDSASGSGPDMVFERYSLTTDELVALTRKSLIKTADKLNEELGEDVNKLYDTSSYHLIAFMRHLDLKSLRQVADFAMLGTSYKDESIKQLFISYLPKVGTYSSVLLMRDLIVQRELDVKQSLKVLVDLPFNLRYPNVALLKECKGFLSLEDHDPAVRKTAVLTFASMVGKICQTGQCPPAILDEYVKILFSRLRDAKEYDEQMLYINAMGNVRIGPVTGYLEPIISGKLTYPRQLRFLAVWAVADEIVTNPAKVHEIFWPILADRRNDLEIRVAALTLLLKSQPTTDRFMNLLWYMVSDPNYQLYQYFYTTIRSLTNTKFPCYSKLATAAQQIVKMLPKLPNKKAMLTTSNEILDFIDPDVEAGSMYQVIAIGSERSAVSDLIYFHAITHKQGQVFNPYSIFLRTEGFDEFRADSALKVSAEDPAGAENDLQTLFDKLKVQRRQSDKIHVELVLKVQGRAVISEYFNETGINKMVTVLSHIQRSSLSHHLNYQTLEQAAFFESIFPSDLGSAIIIESSTLPQMDIRGNFTYNVKAPTMAFNVSLASKFEVRRGYGLRIFNPVSALWHGAHRPSVQVISFPIDFGLSFDMQQKTFKTRLGWNKDVPLFNSLSHGRSKVYVTGSSAPQKALLTQTCPQCKAFTEVRASDTTSDREIFKFNPWDSGVEFRLATFDCDGKLDIATPFLKPLFLKRFSNYGYEDFDLESFLSVLAIQTDMLLAIDPLLNSCGRHFSVTPVGDTSGVETVFKMENGKENAEKRLYRFLTNVFGTDGHVTKTWDTNIISDGTENETKLNLKVKIAFKRESGPNYVTCLKVDNTYPERGPETYWDQLGQPYESRKTQHHLALEFGVSEEAKCPVGKGARIELVASTDHQGLDENVWPFSTCLDQRKRQNFLDSKGNLLFPATFACAMSSWGPRPRNISMTLSVSNIPGIDTVANNQIGASMIKREGKSYSMNVETAHALKGDSLLVRMKSDGGTDKEFKLPLPFSSAPYIVSETLAHYPSVQNLEMALDMIHPCLLAGGKVMTFDNASLPFEAQDQFTLISAVCTENSPFAVFARKTDGADALTVKVFLDGHEINIEPSNGHKSKVTIAGGEQVKDLKTQGITITQREKGKVDIKQGNFYVRNTDVNLAVLVPSTYDRYYCGVCGDANKVPEYQETLGPEGNKISTSDLLQAYTLQN
ncbi:uncharacterized protein LOC132202465 isoform X2 [Neocloeon triangulifer]|uniref:uncharacterized protein LOC132202465 isoform X2 n=1 Tax=Neocloeon triangulifer TaxID=2078957 RepID=UPI00286EC885|nr:uncharacterized protein LOC132202465 isoform X2 [Neocloeon triangulifer]